MRHAAPGLANPTAVSELSVRVPEGASVPPAGPILDGGRPMALDAAARGRRCPCPLLPMSDKDTAPGT